MVFSSGAKVTADIVEEIATRLIATTTPGAYWTDITAVDPSATMWTTTTKTQDSAKRALVYNNGVETAMYMALEVINRDNGIQFYYDGVWRYAKGIRVVVSPSWNSTTHTYPTTNPGIDHQSTFIPFECRGRNNAGVTGNLATMLITYYLWVESNGFVIMGKPEPEPNDSEQQSFILALERVDTIKKRYVDGYSNFYVYAHCNMLSTMYDGNNVTVAVERNRGVLRPFAYQWPDLTVDWNAWVNGYGISFSPLPGNYAYKSTGNGKVYYIKPIIHNQANAMTPIFQGELFFLWSEGVGLIDGDIVAIQGQPTKFICKALDSPDSVTRLTYAIKYLG